VSDPLWVELGPWVHHTGHTSACAHHKCCCRRRHHRRSARAAAGRECAHPLSSVRQSALHSTRAMSCNFHMLHIRCFSVALLHMRFSLLAMLHMGVAKASRCSKMLHTRLSLLAMLRIRVVQASLFSKMLHTHTLLSIRKAAVPQLLNRLFFYCSFFCIISFLVDGPQGEQHHVATSPTPSTNINRVVSVSERAVPAEHCRPRAGGIGFSRWFPPGVTCCCAVPCGSLGSSGCGYHGYRGHRRKRHCDTERWA
jgi:hypothetical protein